MIEQLLKQLNGYEELQKNLKTFKEAFIEYYGEDKRSVIEERFQKMLPIAYLVPDDIQHFLIQLEKEKTKELLTKLLENKDTSLNYEDLFGDVGLQYSGLQPLNKYLKFYEEYQKGREKRTEEFYQKGFNLLKRYIQELTYEDFLEIVETKKLPEKYSNLPEWLQQNALYYAKERNVDAEYRRRYEDAKDLLEKVVPEITFQSVETYEREGKLDQLNSLIEGYLEAEKEFKDFKSSIKKYYDAKDLVDNHKEKLREKYYKKLIQEFIHLIPMEKRTNIEEYLRNEKNSSYLDSYIKFLFGYSVESPSILEAFSEESNEKINNPEERPWIKQSIIEDRIRYFKKNGIDLGNNYEDYCQSKEAQAILPDNNSVQEFLKKKEEILNQFYNEFYTTLPTHQKTRAEIDSLGLLDKEDSFDAQLYTTKTTAINPNVRKTSSGYELYSLLLISLDTGNTGCLDHNIVHELNHLYELSLQMAGERGYTVVCGWDSFTGNVNQEKQEIVDTIHVDDSKRDYELFNEIINELIAQDICEIMHKNNSYVFDTETNSQYKRTTSYESSLFLVREFFEENKQEIIESRSDGNISIIWENVGKENFDELNELFQIYYENFAGLKYYRLLDELHNNKDTELTRVYHELLNRKEEVLEKMRMYKETHKKNNYDK